MRVGGPGHVIEIDETSVAKKKKYGRGKKHPKFWVFGGYDRTSKKWFAAITFHDRTKATMSAVIADMILQQ
ncbi:hypothetical protein PINS_up023217 [Pythium insidiosum]|nr:hypothetical protein PINS_up006432 [Pythium insidiosum]GLE10944.1 hypothetical protein PINS_up023217 [Pythium insidiosum]